MKLNEETTKHNITKPKKKNDLFAFHTD